MLRRRAVPDRTGSLRSSVTILRGPHRNKTGWIKGELARQNPYVSKVLVFLEGGDVVAVAIADVTEAAQLELGFTNEKSPATAVKPGRGGGARSGTWRPRGGTGGQVIGSLR